MKYSGVDLLKPWPLPVGLKGIGLKVASQCPIQALFKDSKGEDKVPEKQQHLTVHVLR